MLSVFIAFFAGVLVGLLGGWAALTGLGGRTVGEEGPVTEQDDVAQPDPPATGPPPATPADQVQTDAPWQLDRIDQRDLPLDGEYHYRYTGDGVILYVIDLGVSPHSDFSARMAPGFDAVDGAGSETNPQNQHGTRMAGIAAGTIRGPAKDATVVPVRILVNNPSGSDFGNQTWQTNVQQAEKAAYEWILANHPQGVRGVTVNAYGGNKRGGMNTVPELDGLIRDLLDAGIVVVWSAFNTGNNLTSREDSHPDATLNPEAIIVGATNESDNRWSNSAYGDAVDLYGPGQGVVVPTGSGSDTTTDNGTSYSAPLVAGICALLLEANPTLTPAQVKAALIDGATTGEIGSLPAGHNRLAYSLVDVGEPGAGDWGDDTSFP